MGAFFTNYQVRGRSASDVSKAFAALAESYAYVSSEKNGWVTVYDEASDKQDEEILKHIAAELSKTLNAAVLAFLVHDSDIAAYWLFQNGDLTDEFNSAPDYFAGADEKVKSRVRGNAEKLLPLCVAGTTHAQVEEVIHPRNGYPAFAEQILHALSRLLGIDDARLTLGFQYFEQEGEEILDDASEFTPVGKRAPKEKTRLPKRATKRATVTLDFFPLAVGMMTKCWSEKQKEKAEAMNNRYSNQIIDITSQLDAGYDGVALKFLKMSTLPDAPTFKQLKAARDEGPDALAELLVQCAPKQLGDIANGAIEEGLAQFIAALLANGMDPNGSNQHGESLLSVAERCEEPAIYEILKSAIDKKA
jgi:hypothetical protein